MKARAGLILAIVTTVEVKVELQLWSIIIIDYISNTILITGLGNLYG